VPVNNVLMSLILSANVRSLVPYHNDMMLKPL
jgi:hypothetical protein